MAPSVGTSREEMISAALRVYWEEFNKTSIDCEEGDETHNQYYNEGCGGSSGQNADLFWNAVNQNPAAGGHCGGAPPASYYYLQQQQQQPMMENRCSLNSSCAPPPCHQGQPAPTEQSLAKASHIVICAGTLESGLCAYASVQSLSKCQQPPPPCQNDPVPSNQRLSCQQQALPACDQQRASCQQIKKESPPLEEVWQKSPSCSGGMNKGSSSRPKTSCGAEPSRDSKGQCEGSASGRPSTTTDACTRNSVGVGAEQRPSVAHTECGQSNCVSQNNVSIANATCEGSGRQSHCGSQRGSELFPEQCEESQCGGNVAAPPIKVYQRTEQRESKTRRTSKGTKGKYADFGEWQGNPCVKIPQWGGRKSGNKQ